MNELQIIVDAYGEARARGERAALATVIEVIGSAYRRPGARMLITESGKTFGTISGGCLERDVVERAGQVIASGAAQIIEYDTRGNEDIVWGLGLGCNGVVRILLESLHEESDGTRALKFIGERLHARQSGIIATVTGAMETSVVHSNEARRCHSTGARVLLDHERSVVYQSLSGEKIVAQIREDAREVLSSGRANIQSYETKAGHVEIFFDLIMPPRALIIFGAEQDAQPVVHLARTLGWHITLVDTRARSASPERFREADEVILCRTEDIATRIPLSQDAAAVIMTHNYLDDIALLRQLLPSQASYLGILGPKQRTMKLLEELAAEGIHLTDAQVARLHSPIGLDIGAETPEEIALSIIAEANAAFARRGGGFLRDRNAPIHDEVASCVTAEKLSTATLHTPARESEINLICTPS